MHSLIKATNNFQKTLVKIIYDHLFFSLFFFLKKCLSLSFFFFKIYLLTDWLIAMLGLRFCARAFSSCGRWGPLFIAVRGPLTIVASLVAEHRLQTRRLTSCGSRAQLLRGMWDLPRPGLEPVSPALAGRFSTTAPPGKPSSIFLIVCFSNAQALFRLYKNIIQSRWCWNSLNFFIFLLGSGASIHSDLTTYLLPWTRNEGFYRIFFFFSLFSWTKILSN